MTIREDGTERKVTAAEAFLLQLTKQGWEGDNAVASATLRAMEDVRAHGPVESADTVSFSWQIVSPGSVNGALTALRMAKLLHDYSEENAPILLAPWIVKAARVRIETRALTPEQNEIVKNACPSIL